MRARHDALDRHEIRDLLATAAAAYMPNRDPNAWADTAAPTWATALQGIPGEWVRDAFGRWATSEARMPKPADILDLARDGRESARGCPDCEGSGVREVAWHRRELDMDGREIPGSIRATVYAAKCRCPLGARMLGQSLPVERLVDLLTARPHHVALHVTDRYQPRLTLAQRFGDEHAARLRALVVPEAKGKATTDPTGAGVR